MQITEVNLPEDITNNVGLEAVLMKRIGKTVLLAGKNGSGKTRIYKLVQQEAKRLSQIIQQKTQAESEIKQFEREMKNQPQQKVQLETSIKTNTKHINSCEEQLKKLPINKQNLEENIKQQTQKVTTLKLQIEQQPEQKVKFEDDIKQITQQIAEIEKSIIQHPQQKQTLVQSTNQKTQQINTLKQQINQQPVQKQQLERNISQADKNINSYEQQIKQIPEQIKQVENQIVKFTQQIENSNKKIEQLPEQKKRLEEDIEQKQQQISIPLPIICENEKITVIEFIPNKIELEDWSNQSKQQWTNKANQAKNLGITTIHQTTIPLIQQISERFFNTSHPYFDNNDPANATEKEVAFNEYQRLQGIIKSFLDTEISWNKDGFSTIFEQPIAQASLSAGQRILLQLCVAIFSQGGSLTDHVIFMDEPENHLHPSAVIDLLDTLREHNPSGQIWIATHSIPLLSHFEASALWFVESGIVKPSGKKPEVVLKSLLGNDESVQKLKDFISLPDELARTRFAFECLCPPQVVETDSNDPQSIQLNQQLKLIWDEKESLKLLDFGAGKGRMIANLVDYDNVTSTTLDYHAYDLFDDDKDYCLSNISLSYDDPENRYHNSIELLRTKLGDNYFDVIVLSNVLHEIPHTEWCSIFEDMSKLLKEDGYLLLIEDCLIPTGELPHRNGFVVFNTLHLQKLFDIPVTETHFIHHDARFDSVEQRGRLMAHLIPTQYLTNSSSDTIKTSLTELKNSAKTEIKKVRAKEVSYSNGLAHSFWIQQLANTVLCLSEYGEG